MSKRKRTDGKDDKDMRPLNELKVGDVFNYVKKTWIMVRHEPDDRGMISSCRICVNEEGFRENFYYLHHRNTMVEYVGRGKLIQTTRIELEGAQTTRLAKMVRYEDCPMCNGTGGYGDAEPCNTCNGRGTVQVDQ